MRVVCLAATRFGRRCVDELRTTDRIDVVAVVTAPSSFAISYRPQGVVNVLHEDMTEACRTWGLPCEVMTGGMNEPGLLDRVRAWQPDLFVAAGWYHVVPRSWRSVAPAFGLHASLLPDYAGGAPLVWALINGESRCGITLFQLDDTMDGGPVVGQAETCIADDDTIATVYGRIEELGVALLRSHLPAVAAGTATLTPQDLSRRRTFPQRGPEDGRIDWSRDARDVFNFIRAQTRPYPGAFTSWQGRIVTIWSAALASDTSPPDAATGAAILRGQLLVGTGRGVVALREIEYDGQVMRGDEFWRTLAVAPRFE